MIMEVIHVYPIDDLHEHSLVATHSINTVENYIEVGSQCDCKPDFIIMPLKLIVKHHSFDGREGVEWVNELLNNT